MAQQACHPWVNVPKKTTIALKAKTELFLAVFFLSTAKPPLGTVEYRVHYNIVEKTYCVLIRKLPNVAKFIVRMQKSFMYSLLPEIVEKRVSRIAWRRENGVCATIQYIKIHVFVLVQTPPRRNKSPTNFYFCIWKKCSKNT